MYHQWPRHCSWVLALTWKEEGICLGRGGRPVGGVREENRVQDRRIWWKYMTCLNKNITVEPTTLHNQYTVIKFLMVYLCFIPHSYKQDKMTKGKHVASLLEDIHCRFTFGLHTVLFSCHVLPCTSPLRIEAQYLLPSSSYSCSQQTAAS